MSSFRLFAVLCSLFLAGSAHADTVRVMASIKPLQQIAAAVLDGVDTPAALLPAGASPHSFALRPSDRRALASAERVYWVGPSLELFLESTLHELPSERELAEIPGLHLRHFSEGAGKHEEHEHEAHAHDSHEDHAGHNHRPGSLDPHIWLSPENAVIIARWMKDDLAPLYPEQQAQLDANLASFEQRMQALDQQLVERFAPLKNKAYFVFHDGYGYLEDYLGITHHGVFTLAHEIQPGARHVNELRNALKAAVPACVFSEPQFTPRLVNSLTEGLPVKSAQLDPLGSAIEVGPQGYEQQLKALIDSWAGCLESI